MSLVKRMLQRKNSMKKKKKKKKQTKMNEPSKKYVAKEDLNEEEEKDEEMNKLIEKYVANEDPNEEEVLDGKAEDADNGKGTELKLPVGKWSLFV